MMIVGSSNSSSSSISSSSRRWSTSLTTSWTTKSLRPLRQERPTGHDTHKHTDQLLTHYTSLNTNLTISWIIKVEQTIQDTPATTSWGSWCSSDGSSQEGRRRSFVHQALVLGSASSMARVHQHGHIYIYIFIYICLYIHIYIYIYIWLAGARQRCETACLVYSYAMLEVMWIDVNDNQFTNSCSRSGSNPGHGAM